MLVIQILINNITAGLREQAIFCPHMIEGRTKGNIGSGLARGPYFAHPLHKWFPNFFEPRSINDRKFSQYTNPS